MQGLTKKQQEIANFIEKFISENHYSPSFREIRDFFGFSSLGTVYGHIQVLKKKKIISESKGIRSLRLNRNANASFDIPLIGKLRPGMPLETFSKIQMLSFPDEIIPLAKSSCYFIRVEGKGLMEECLLENDLLLVEPKTTFKEGETAIAVIDQMTTFVKRIFSDPPYLRLESANPEFSPIILRQENVQIQGIVLAVFRNLAS